ncbi:RNA polymerase sigma factor [Zavarzinella formosa]|uniref:RNA polymerase sigma factor n=1 Tax=Zavarzinella formosa TaxID=360055 RepID=UPI000309CDF5|nr:sigma-70 family RNA polymerase sigma factor [Zavarzinella formosa]
METSVSLIARLAAAPSETDWRRLHDLYRPLLLRWTARAGVPAVDADDLVQEVMVVVVTEVSGFIHRGEGAFRAWLRGILANRLREFFRLRNRRPVATGDDDFQDLLGELECPESSLSKLWDREHDHHVAGQLLIRVRGDFAPVTWQAFRLQVLDGHPARRVADELGQSLNAVLLAKSRVLKRLREESHGLID